jgi:glucose dehydrogenase
VRTDWLKFHFDLQNSGFNPYENVLNPANVSNLSVKWSYFTGGSTFFEGSRPVNGARLEEVEPWGMAGALMGVHRAPIGDVRL